VGFDILTSTLGKIIPLIFQNFDQKGAGGGFSLFALPLSLV